MLNSLLSFLINLVIGILGIGLIVFLHELGHFFAARLFNIDVETLSFGMGPVIFSHDGKHTTYCISLLPFGGYCRIKGSVELTKALKDKQNEFTHTEKGSFFGTTPFIRFLIFLAGPITNFIISVLLFTSVYAISTQVISNPALVLKITDYPSLYSSTFEQTTLLTGDEILTLEGKEITDWESLTSILANSDGATLKALVKRGKDTFETTLSPTENNGHYSFGLALYQSPIVGRIDSVTELKVNDKILAVDGITINNTNDFYSHVLDKEVVTLTVLRKDKQQVITIKGGTSFDFAWKSNYKTQKGMSFIPALVKGFNKAINVSKTTVEALYNIISAKAKTEEVRNTLTGPTRAAQSIGMITMLGAKTSLLIGFRAFIYLLAIVSISICVANLLPIPNFDGGQMLINLYSIVRKKDLTPKGYVILQLSGLVCTILILLFMYGLDFKHYFMH